MKGALRLRRSVEVAPDELSGDEPAGADLDSRVQSSWTGGPALATKAATGVLWAGLLAGPAALLLTLSGGSSSSAAALRPAPPVVDRMGEQVAAAEFAGRLVTVWLTSVRGQEAQLAPLLGGATVSLPTVAWSVGPAAAADERRLPDGTWKVITAVPVRPPAGLPAVAAGATQDSASGPAGWPVRYFQVPVRLTATGPVALALPAPVAGPGTAGQSPRLDYRFPVASDDPVGVSVTQFLAALLTGAGDVTRYVSPGTTISAILPAPYTTVDVTDISADRELTAGASVPADGTGRRVLVTAAVTGGPQQQSTVQYALTLTVRGGRWEITAIDAAPALQSDADPQTGPAGPSAAAATAAAPTAAGSATAPSGSTPSTPSR